MAGGLVEIFTAPYAVLVDAISFWARGCFSCIRKQEEPPAREAADGSKPSLGPS